MNMSGTQRSSKRDEDDTSAQVRIIESLGWKRNTQYNHVLVFTQEPPPCVIAELNEEVLYRVREDRSLLSEQLKKSS